MSATRRVGYAVVGVVAVVLVLVFWSRVDGSGPGASSASPSPSREVSAGDPVIAGATYGPDDVVMTADGDRYMPPHVTLRRQVLVVDQPVEARPSAGVVEVMAPTLRVRVDGDEMAPIAGTDERSSRRTDGGGLVSFGAGFDAATAAGPVGVGDEVTVSVTTGDGVTYDVVGVGVADGRRYTH